MTLTNITPRTQKALRDGKRLYYCADLWKSVLNDKIDSQDDFEASVQSSNMDFTTSSGFARLAEDLGAYDIDQSASDSAFAMLPGDGYYHSPHQSFTLSPGRRITSITVSIDNTALGAGTLSFVVFKGTTNLTLAEYDAYVAANQMLAVSKAYIAGYVGDVTATFSPVDLPEGVYTLRVRGPAASTATLAYNSVDVYAGGSLTCGKHWNVMTGTSPILWHTVAGDLYFKLELSGYKSSGYFVTKTMDLEKVPADTGFFQMSADIPTGTTLTATAYGSTTGAFAGEETTYIDIDDGWIAPAGIRYWRVRIDMSTNADLDQTPIVDMLEFYYPDDRIRFRQRGVKLRNVSDEILRDFQPLLVPGSFSPSEIKPIERISSLGTFPIELKDFNPDRIQRMVSDSPLKNFRAALYLGADVPGFAVSDLFRVCIGIVDNADISPKYLSDSYSLSMTIKNPMLELKQKAPLPEETGLLNFETLAIDHDGFHVMDSKIDIMRGKARIPARYINLSSFTQGKLVAGSGSPDPAAHLVRRADNTCLYSDATAAPDTRIKSPTEIVKLLTPLCIISDGYIVPDENSRLKYVHHDATGSDYEETWADQDLVIDGTDAVRIESVSKIALGYADFLYNLTYVGCEWDGSGDSWGESFKKVYGHLDADSADDWAPGKDLFVSVMEANMLEVGKWLGPENGYNGETLAAAIAARMTGRYAYPPVRIQGAVLPVSQYMRGLGSVVRVWSKEFCKFKRRGIALSESIRFMVTKQVYDQGKNKMIFDLLELT